MTDDKPVRGNYNPDTGKIEYENVVDNRNRPPKEKPNGSRVGSNSIGSKRPCNPDSE